MKGIWEDGQEGIQQIRTDAGDNPYLIADGIENAFVRDRIMKSFPEIRLHRQTVVAGVSPTGQGE